MKTPLAVNASRIAGSTFCFEFLASLTACRIPIPMTPPSNVPSNVAMFTFIKVDTAVPSRKGSKTLRGTRLPGFAPCPAAPPLTPPGQSLPNTWFGMQGGFVPSAYPAGPDGGVPGRTPPHGFMRASGIRTQTV